MKRFVFLLLSVLSVAEMQAQPRPYESDPSFVPSLEFIQKCWTGEYDGLEPNSKMILSLSRTLVLNTDFTYTNEVRGKIKEQMDEKLLRFETGVYQYGSDNHLVTYTIEMDSTIDVNILLKGEELTYKVNRYKEEGIEKTSAEGVQFTRADTDGERQWIFLDQQLMSPIDPRQKAVYVMKGKDIKPSGILQPYFNDGCKDVYYNLSGQKSDKAFRGLNIFNGKKVLLK